MPYCAGRPDGPCPFRRTGRKVHTNAVYDVQLCNDCLEYREAQRKCQAVIGTIKVGSRDQIDQVDVISCARSCVESGQGDGISCAKSNDGLGQGVGISCARSCVESVQGDGINCAKSNDEIGQGVEFSCVRSGDRKCTRLNCSHSQISYAVFYL